MGLLDTLLSYVLIVFMFTVLSQAGLNLANNNFTEASTQADYNTNSNKTNSTLSGFNFASAGDCGCNEISQRTVNNIQNNDPKLILGWKKIRLESFVDIPLNNTGDLTLLYLNNGRQCFQSYYR